MREIEIIREQRKPEIIRNALRGGYAEDTKTAAHFGECKYVKYCLENSSIGEKDYRIRIDRGNTVENELEFDLVRDAKEWREVASTINSEPPAEWDMLQSGDIVSLRREESVELVFRFLTYDSSVLKPGTQLSKNCGFTITDMAGQVVGGLSLQFEVFPPLVDRTLRFFELEGRTVELPVPRLFSEEQISHQKPFIVATDPKARVNWVSSTDVTVSMRTQSAPITSQFFLAVYSSINRCKALGIFKVEV